MSWSVGKPVDLEVLWVYTSILHSFIPTHIFTVSNAFTCTKIFPLGA